MKYLNDEQIKEELTIMLAQLDSILSEEKIEYSIMSGTMLGAVRHSGFIPWDDDIDVGMTRKEFTRFVSLLKENKLLFGYGYAVGNGNFPYIKIVNKNIKVVDKELLKPQYLWIDVFPFDYIDAGWQFTMINFMRKILYFKRCSENELTFDTRNGSFLKRLKDNILLLITKIVSIKYINNKIDKLCIECNNKFKNSKYMADLSWGRLDNKKFVPATLFDDLIDYKFEGITVKGFKDYDTYLNCIYGNYMELPPEDQRVNHGVKAWRVTDNEE